MKQLILDRIKVKEGVVVSMGSFETTAPAENTGGQDNLQIVAQSAPCITRSEFQEALKGVRKKLSADEDALWSAKAKAGRASGMQSAEETANRTIQQKSANKKRV